MDNNGMYSAPEDNQQETQQVYESSTEPVISSTSQFQSQLEPKKNSSGMAIAAMVCGIISIVTFCFWPVSLLLAVVAIVLGIIVLVKKIAGKGMAIAGISTGVFGIVATIVYILFLAAVLVAGGAL